MGTSGLTDDAIHDGGLCENGDDLGPGWIVWRLKQGPVKAARARREAGWFEERYQRGKGGE